MVKDNDDDKEPTDKVELEYTSSFRCSSHSNYYKLFAVFLLRIQSLFSEVVSQHVDALRAPGSLQ